MIRAVYRDGTIQPLEGIPRDWQDGDELAVEHAEKFLGPDDEISDLEQRLAEFHALGPAGFEPGEREDIERFWKELDDLGRQEMQRNRDQRL